MTEESATLFLRAPSGEWQSMPVNAAVNALEPCPAGAQPAESGTVAPGIAPAILRCAVAGRVRWVVVAPAVAKWWVNGRRLRQLRVLHHRDSLWRPGSTPAYFSTERRARIEPYPGTDADTICVRCKTAIEPGQPAVSCTACGFWHHEHSEHELQCWTYAETCASCRRQPTALDAGLSWIPEAD